MSQQAHPYRQRVQQTSSIPSNNTSPNSSNYQSPNIDHISPLNPQYQYGEQQSTSRNESGYVSANSHYNSPSAPYPLLDTPLDKPLESVASNGLDDHMNGLSLSQPVHHPLHESNQISVNKLSGYDSNQASIPPYLQNQLHNAQSTPPQIFSSNITSPPSNPLSATSSVTNLNISSSAMGYSKGENNLVTPMNNHKRSTSSASSVFDRSTDNVSVVDFNQNLLTQYLGDNSNHLMPRIKTIELYRKNARRSNDPTVLFQYAQYMLQTALLLDKEGEASNANLGPSSVENSPLRGPADGKDHKKSKSSNSFDLSNLSDGNINDRKLKKALLNEAILYLKKLSDKGYVDAQYLLGDAYSSGALGKVDNKEAYALFQAAAKRGHTESAYRTSYCYEEGLGTGRDARKAVEYLKMAASKNHPAAMYKLGVYSFYGRMGLPTNDVNTKKMGIKWLERASNVANELIAAAPYELGKIYFNGFKDIVIEDKKYALELYSRAAALGHIQSSAILGHYYEIGEIVAQDSNLSIHYYTQAALGGDPNSMLAMCAWYLVGNDPYLPKDENESFEWAKRAAMCNLAKGQFALANFYDKGIGCEKNPTEAQNWYIKAAENGDEKAITRINNKELANKLQKKLKKKKSGSKMVPSITSNLDFDSKAARDKDCVIM